MKPFFFAMEPEAAHNRVTKGLSAFQKIWGAKSILRSSFCVESPRLERKVFGLTFKNPVGLAAGFDKNAEFVEELSHLGFGFIEIGTVTPKPQPGNERPRMFRLVDDEALINRMGFNNQGVDVAAGRLKALKNKNRIIIGGNIGKNKVTPNEQAVNDYIYSFHALYPYVDYFVVNVSSPNTPGLRDLQEKEPLTHLLNELQSVNKLKPKSKPILLKIAPDLTHSQLDDIIDIVQNTKIAGLIATNTTIGRENLESSQSLQKETGGLSGKPLTRRSTEVIRYISQKTENAFPIIGVGGIHSAEEALEKLNAGASLIQVYTGFIYEGPGLIKQICQGILNS